MGRKVVPLDQRKMTITLSVPYETFLIMRSIGSSNVVKHFNLGKWASENNINALTLAGMINDFREKIMALQNKITDGNEKKEVEEAAAV